MSKQEEVEIVDDTRYLKVLGKPYEFDMSVKYLKREEIGRKRCIKEELEARADGYISGLVKHITGISDAKRSAILIAEVRYWYRSAQFWSSRFQEATPEKHDG